MWVIRRSFEWLTNGWGESVQSSDQHLSDAVDGTALTDVSKTYIVSSALRTHGLELESHGLGGNSPEQSAYIVLGPATVRPHAM